MKINLTNTKQLNMNLKIFMIALLLGSKFAVNAIGINTVKSLQSIF